ncbi:hypothetical protein BH11PLA2_BH11PLA2_41010 [soil metagenome]
MSVLPPRSNTRMFSKPQQCGILVVEDNEGIRRMLAVGLAFYGYKVWLAADVIEAIECYRDNCSMIALALLDVQIPHQDGPAILNELKTINPEIRVCFMTGHPGRYCEKTLLDLGALAVIQKPFGLSELTQRISEFIKP